MLIFSCLFLIALDQYSKILAVQMLELGVPVPVIDGFFNFTLVHNKGAAFGMFAGIENDTMRLCFLWGATAVAIGVVSYLYIKEMRGSRLHESALACILAGAIGNVIDRIRLGYVIDFFDFYYKDYHWPAFNIADSAICVGVIFLILLPANKKKVT